MKEQCLRCGALFSTSELPKHLDICDGYVYIWYIVYNHEVIIVLMMCVVMYLVQGQSLK